MCSLKIIYSLKEKIIQRWPVGPKLWIFVLIIFVIFVFIIVLPVFLYSSSVLINNFISKYIIRIIFFYSVLAIFSLIFVRATKKYGTGKDNLLACLSLIYFCFCFFWLTIVAVYTHPDDYFVAVLSFISMLFIAKFYTKILNRFYFYRISMLVEIIMLFLLLYFLIFSYSYTTALIIYIGYQVTFSFGSYLVRAETVLLNNAKILTFLDVAKQKGYLVGMLVSYMFYKVLENFLHVESFNTQVYYLHFLLLATELVTIFYLYLAFKTKP